MENNYTPPALTPQVMPFNAPIPQQQNTSLQPLQNTKLDMAEVQRVAVSLSLDPNNSLAISGFGANAQTHSQQFADALLKQVRVKDAGDVGQAVSALMQKCKSVDMNDFTGKKKTGLSQVPFLGKWLSKGQDFMAKYDKLGDEVDKIASQLVQAKTALEQDVKNLDIMSEANARGYLNLEVHIEAANMRLRELTEQIIPQAQSKAVSTSDPLDAQYVQALTQLQERMEKKIHDLTISKAICLQTYPQLALIKSNNITLSEKIQGAVATTIPLWKNQLVTAIALMRQQSAVSLLKDVTDTTNDLMRKNADMLKQSSIATATETQRSIVDLSTLQHVQAQLISSIDEIERIQSEGKRNRASAEIELQTMQQQLKDRLLGNGSSGTQGYLTR